MRNVSDPAQSAIDIAELAANLREQRKRAGLSLRDLSAETGVPYATLSRVEAGRVPDLSTFRSIVAWLGIPAERFFPTPRLRQESTPDFVAHALRQDVSLTTQAREQLIDVFAQMYATLTASSQPVSLHLRAQRAFAPEAGELLADLLGQMETALLAEPRS